MSGPFPKVDTGCGLHNPDRFGQNLQLFIPNSIHLTLSSGLAFLIGYCECMLLWTAGIILLAIWTQVGSFMITIATLSASPKQ